LCEVVEYVARFSAACQANWLQNVMEDLIVEPKQLVKLLCRLSLQLTLLRIHSSWEEQAH